MTSYRNAPVLFILKIWHPGKEQFVDMRNPQLYRTHGEVLAYAKKLIAHREDIYLCIDFYCSKHRMSAKQLQETVDKRLEKKQRIIDLWSIEFKDR